MSACVSPRPGLRVLVVDDNQDIADTTAKLLQMWGHQARVAYDGAAALTQARACPPEVGLLDIGMPLMDGYALARRFRHETCLAETTLVAISAYSAEEFRRLGVEAGFDLHLVKPVAPGLLRRMLEAIQKARFIYGEIEEACQRNWEIRRRTVRALRELRAEIERER